MPPISDSFVRGASTKLRKWRPNLLNNSRDWKLRVDFDSEKILFPPEIYATSERPDIVIWSVKGKTLIMIELTWPEEEGIESPQLRKEARYDPLKTAIEANGVWFVELITIEVGARGYVAHSLPR